MPGKERDESVPESKLNRAEPRARAHVCASTGPAINRESYDRIAQAWSNARRGFFGREREYLDAVLERVPDGAAVLDLGCGTGRPMAEYVVSRCRRVIGIDQSAALLAIARASLPCERWMLATIEDYDIRDDYAGVIAWDSLFHVPRAGHGPILRKAVEGLPVGGRLMVTVGGSAHPPFTDHMFGETFYYDSNTPDETSNLLRELGCRIVLAEFMNVPDGGRDKGRYAIVAERDR